MFDYGILKKRKVKCGDVELDAWEGDVDAPILGNVGQNMIGQIRLIPVPPEERKAQNERLDAAGKVDKRVADFTVEFAGKSTRGRFGKLGLAYYNEDRHGNYYVGISLVHDAFPRGRALLNAFAYDDGEATSACAIADETQELQIRMPARGGQSNDSAPALF